MATGSDDNTFSLVSVDDLLHVAVSLTGLARYDFRFEDFFPCRHPVRLDREALTVARMGAADDYAARYASLLSNGIRLIHTPDQYERTSNLPEWYPLIEDLTPRSAWYDAPPDPSEVEYRFGWPIFMKGARQTSRHQRKLSIINNRQEYEHAVRLWQSDPILAWQRVVCRQFVPLRPVGSQSPHTLPRAFEFRSFWWNVQCVGIGPYWTDHPYDLTSAERAAALSIAGDAARRLAVPFLVVDVAQTLAGHWTVIECNDAQDSGYAGVHPLHLWQRILDLQRDRSA